MRLALSLSEGPIVQKTFLMSSFLAHIVLNGTGSLVSDRVRCERV